MRAPPRHRCPKADARRRSPAPQMPHDPRRSSRRCERHARRRSSWRVHRRRPGCPAPVRGGRSCGRQGVQVRVGAASWHRYCLTHGPVASLHGRCVGHTKRQVCPVHCAAPTPRQDSGTAAGQRQAGDDIWASTSLSGPPTSTRTAVVCRWDGPNLHGRSKETFAVRVEGDRSEYVCGSRLLARRCGFAALPVCGCGGWGRGCGGGGGCRVGEVVVGGWCWLALIRRGR